MWRRFRTVKKKKGHGWGAAGKRTKESDALEKAETEQIGSSLVAENNATSSSEKDGDFTLFPQIPLELRVKIWALTFKKEHVDLDIQNFWPAHRIGPGREMHALPRPRFPVALHVNRESRTETMRHYCIISTSKLRLTRASTPPICVNLSLDSCFIDACPTSKSKFATAYTDWFTKLASVSRGGLARLQELEVRNIRWDQSYKADINQERMSTSDGRAHYILTLKLILQFTGLKRICFTLKIFMGDPSLATLLRDAPHCRETVQAFMDRHKDNFIGNTAPEVEVRFWSERDNAFRYSSQEGDNLL